MRTREARSGESGGLGRAAKVVADRARAMARLEIELALAELKGKVASLGIGIGLAIGGAIVAVFAIGFLFATIVAALAIVLDLWLALIVVTAGLFVVAALLVVVGVTLIKRGTPPVPEQAIAEAKLTSEALRANGSH